MLTLELYKIKFFSSIGIVISEACSVHCSVLIVLFVRVLMSVTAIMATDL